MNSIKTLLQRVRKVPFFPFFNQDAESSKIGLEELEPRLLLSGSPMLPADGVMESDFSLHSHQNEIPHSIIIDTIEEQSSESELNDPRQELVVIDSNTPDVDLLLEDLRDRISSKTIFETLILDSNRSGIDQISEVLQHYENLNAIHIVSHGADGVLNLGAEQLHQHSVSEYAQQIADWGDAFSDTADFLIYGCDFAEGVRGQSLVHQLSTLTGLDVAANKGLTGNSSLGGDWNLEYTRGDVESNVAFSSSLQANFSGVLDSANFQEGANSYTGTVDTYIDSNDPDTEVSTEANVRTDGNRVQQGLIRFDNIFGNGAGQIPLGSTINSATITIDVNNSTSGSANVTLHRMLVPWTETTTWNLMNSGISLDDAEARSTADSTLASPNATGTKTFSGLQAALQDWSSGGNNYGWAVINDHNNNLNFRSSEETVIASRPLLTVDFTPPSSGSSQGVAIWSQSGQTAPESSTFNGTSFGSTSSIADIDGPWKIIAGREAPTRNERIVAGVDSSNNISAQIWNGSTWSSLGDVATINRSDRWSFDVAYETSSGDALFVYANGTSGSSPLSYQVWDGSSWSSATTISTPYSGQADQIKLASNPSNNEIILVASNTNNEDFALVWDGSSWGNSVSLYDGTGSVNNTDVSVAYEQTSGDALVVYGKNGLDASYRVWSSGWSSEGTISAPGSTVGQVRWTTLASDPTSDRLAVGVLTEDQDVWYSVWSGSAWSDEILATGFSSGKLAYNFDIEFESLSGEILATYNKFNNRVYYRTWAASTWSAEQEAANLAGFLNISTSMTLDSDPTSNRIMLSALDSNSDIHFALWDGGSFGSTTELETSSPSLIDQPFIFLWDHTVTSPNSSPTTSGISDVNVNEDASNSVIDLFAAFADAEDADSALTYSITSNTNSALFTSTAIDGAAGTLTLDYAPNVFGSSTLTVRATDTEGAYVETAFTVTVTAIADTPSVTSSTTDEDTQTTSGLVISRNAADSTEVTHFKVTSITGGILYQNDGTTVISNGDFITYAQGNAGLKFTPTADSSSNGSFDIQASTSSVDGGLGGSVVTAVITVNAVADTPSVTNSSTSEDTQTTNGLVISRNANDGSEVTHFKITGITGGTLYQNDGTTAISNGEFITFNQGNAGLKFTPSSNSTSNGSFSVQSSQGDNDSHLGGGLATATISVSAVNDDVVIATNAGLSIANSATETISNTLLNSTDVDNSTSDITYTLTAVTTEGTLRNNGTGLGLTDTFTQADIDSGFLTYQHSGGVALSDSFSFTVKDPTGTALGPTAFSISISASPNNQPTTSGISDVAVSEDASNSVINLFSAFNDIEDSDADLTYTVQTNTNSALFTSTAIDGVAGTLTLDYAPNVSGQADITIRATDTGGLFVEDTFRVTISAVADTPTITNSTTNEDVQTSSGLVVSRNAADSTEVTHFKITNISGGSLYQNDGTTQINNGEFITFAQGNLGLKFTPSSNSSTNGSFDVQASTSANDAGLGGSTTTATITVDTVADTPTVTDASTQEDVQTTTGLVISRNAADSTEVTHFKITGITNGTLYQNDGTTVINNNQFITVAEGNVGLRFTPDGNSSSNGTFGVQASTAGNDGGLGGSVATATITVSSVADTPNVTSAATLEDTQSTSGLVITRNAVDSTEVTHFKIIGIANGTLYQNDGVTQISAGDFITVAQGNAGLKFTPSANSFVDGSISVQASTSSNDSGLGGASAGGAITVTAVADTATHSNAATEEDTQTSSGLVINRNVVDGAEVTHIKITNISNGTLYQNDGVTTISNGDFITYSQANAGLKFTPGLNSIAAGSFNYQASTAANDGGLGGNQGTANISVSPVADTPNVTSAATLEDTQSTSGLVITRNAVDSTEVTHFKITGISAGTLYQNDGVTQISVGDFITVAQGTAGLKFTPSANSFVDGSISVQASTSSSDSGLGGAAVGGTITVTAVADTPTHTDAATIEDSQSTSGLVISRNIADGAEVTHIKITNISNGTLYQNDGVTVISNGDFITYSQANAGLRFTPGLNSNVSGSFNFQASTAANDSGLGGNQGTATISVSAVADTPNVTSASTAEDTQTTNGLVITRNSADSSEVSHFKITGITGGTLFLNDGSTEISNGSFITFSQGNSGLRFTPSENSVTSGSFNVQAATSGSDADLGGSLAAATINVSAVNDDPILVNNSQIEISVGETLTITSSLLQVTDVDNIASELTFTLTRVPSQGALLLNGTALSLSDTFTQQDIDSGLISFRVDEGSESAIQNFSFTVADSTTGTLSEKTFTVTTPLVPSGGSPPAPVENPAPEILESESELPEEVSEESSEENSELEEESSEKTESNESKESVGNLGFAGSAGLQSIIFNPEGAASRLNYGDALEFSHFLSLSNDSAITRLQKTSSIENTSQQGVTQLLESSNFQLDSLGDLNFLADGSQIWDELDWLEEELKTGDKFEAYIVGVATFVGLGVSVGYLLWILRAGYLLSSILSSIPAWRFFDPLPILEVNSQTGNNGTDDDEETLESLIMNSNQSTGNIDS